MADYSYPSLPTLVSSRKKAVEAKCSLACEYLSKEDYMDLLWTTLSEFPGEAGAEKPAKINRSHSIRYKNQWRPGGRTLPAG